MKRSDVAGKKITVYSNGTGEFVHKLLFFITFRVKTHEELYRNFRINSYHFDSLTNKGPSVLLYILNLNSLHNVHHCMICYEQLIYLHFARERLPSG